MENLLVKVAPYLDKVRGWLDVPAQWLAKALELDPERASWIIFGFLSWLIAKKVFDWLYVDTQGRMDKFILLVVAIFFILKFLGAS